MKYSSCLYDYYGPHSFHVLT